MTVFALITAYGTLLLAGAGITLLLASRRMQLNILECFCLSWLFGVGAVSILLWMYGMFASGNVLQWLVATTCLGLAIGGGEIFRRSGSRFRMSLPASRPEWFLLTVLAAEIAIVFYVSCNTPLGWDGLLNWEIKARYAFLSDGVLPAGYFSSPGRGFSHPEYPLAVPFTQLWIYLWLGDANQFWAKTVFPIFFTAGAILLALLSARITGLRWLGYLVSILLFFVPELTIGPGSATLGYADFPLSVFYLATIGYLLCVCIGRRDHSYSMYAACLALLPWLKQEGLILWAVAAVGGAAVILVRRKPRVALLGLAPGLLLIASWHVFLNNMRAVPSDDFIAPTFATFLQHCNRILPILRTVFTAMTSLTEWSVFWILVTIACLIILGRARNLRSWLLLSTVFAPILIYSLSYVFSAWPDYLQHVHTSLSRLLMHVVPVAWLLIGIAFAANASGTSRDVLRDEKQNSETPICD